MSHYRLYLLDEHDHVVHGLDLNCRDDQDARLAAGRFRIGNAVELWQGRRRVGRLDRQSQARPEAA